MGHGNQLLSALKRKKAGGGGGQNMQIWGNAVLKRQQAE